MDRPTYEPDRGAASVRSILRAAAAVAGGPVDDGMAGLSLEARHTPPAAPRIATVVPLEPGAFARDVPGDAVPAFDGFLDGVQESRVIQWMPSGVPLVHAVVGAVILKRVDRRLVSWGDGAIVQRILVAPRALCGDDAWNAMSSLAPVEDSGADAEARHPDALLASAVQRVDELRAQGERRLAIAWTNREIAPLCIDGGISGLGSAARSATVIGVVKSHRTLYADPAHLPQLYALAVGARTQVFALASQSRDSVWSWYLRLRPASAANPLHGLVRVEVAAQSTGASERADMVSEWVLADRSPIALPDARWDVMSYGIARCEAFLKRGLALHAHA